MLALLVCGLLLRRRLVLSLRQRKRDQASPNQAALALYGSLVELHRIAQSRLPGWEEPLPPQLVQLSLKARFSQHTLTPVSYTHLGPVFKKRKPGPVFVATLF